MKRLSLLACILWCSCAVFTPSGKAKARSIDKDGGAILQPPLALEVIRDGFDGDLLSVAFLLSSEISLQKDSVAVKASCLAHGEIVTQKTAPLNELISPSASKEFREPVQGEIRLQAEACDDYQIAVLWGKDADVILKKNVVRASEEGLKLTTPTELTITPFILLPDGETVTLSLKNESTLPLVGPKLLVGFKDSNSPEAPVPLPMYTKKVDLSTVTIPPGGEQPLRFKVGRAPQIGFEPCVVVER